MRQGRYKGGIQSFRLKWIKTNYGLPRFAFICQCGRPVISLYFRYGNFSCRRCTDAIYASQACNKYAFVVLVGWDADSFSNSKCGCGKARASAQKHASLPQQVKNSRASVSPINPYESHLAITALAVLCIGVRLGQAVAFACHVSRSD